MALYLLIAVVFFGFGCMAGIIAALLFGMVISRSQPPRPPQIEPEILAEMVVERLEQQALSAKVEKVIQ